MTHPLWNHPTSNLSRVSVSLENATCSCRGIDIDWDKIERENKDYKRRRELRVAKRKEQTNV